MRPRVSTPMRLRVSMATASIAAVTPGADRGGRPAAPGSPAGRSDLGVGDLVGVEGLVDDLAGAVGDSQLVGPGVGA